ncbi:hypothetical protein BCV72DRAFT_256878 [Rhizopus microsporus var. microsporus]|uniref:Uncharacterized protein n=2 Tax=Rhizopus microsporus TaxID=58291 RepID=A0A2G4SX59_RHIZD|nr:uncharacterized protein RHIMIDRAFT_291538 [Rhizopus microsporus ATCC 52813]ORE05264.1 hypothetical protein BCV72DRAFT_256878 [Rhizopus microsporus var. microsporus]PHZ12956.1 hypothetical protein RHIMIDRAFT_291538 [Rhizopus microsporus ATCC 52813]
MSTRLAKQTLNLLNDTKKTNNDKDTSKKLKLPKINKGIRKVKHEMRYGRHKKTNLLQKEKKRHENPLDQLHQEELSAEERLKRNVQLLQSALKASEVEKTIYRDVIKEAKSKRGKKWSSEVDGSEGDAAYNSD